MTFDSTPRAGQARRRSSVPVVLLVGVALALLVVVALVALLLGGGDGAPASSASAAASGTAAPQSAGASSAPGASQDAAGISPGTMATVAADTLRVREAPTTSAAELGTITAGTRGFVVEGPADADGYSWYLLTGTGIPPQSGCVGPLQTNPFSCPIWYGWVASASPEAEPWVIPGDLECPEPGALDERWVGAQMEPMSLLACFGSEPVTVVGWLAELPEDGGLGGSCPTFDPAAAWLCDFGYTTLMVAAGEYGSAPGLSVAVPPDGADEFEALRGQWVQVTGHFDDPAAEGCPEGHERQRCRARLVVESAVPTTQP